MASNCSNDLTHHIAALLQISSLSSSGVYYIEEYHSIEWITNYFQSEKIKRWRSWSLRSPGLGPAHPSAPPPAVDVLVVRELRWPSLQWLQLLPSSVGFSMKEENYSFSRWLGHDITNIVSVRGKILLHYSGISTREPWSLWHSSEQIIRKLYHNLSVGCSIFIIWDRTFNRPHSPASLTSVSWRRAHTRQKNLVLMNSPVPFHWKIILVVLVPWPVSLNIYQGVVRRLVWRFTVVTLSLFGKVGLIVGQTLCHYWM